MTIIILIFWPHHPKTVFLFGYSVSTVKKSKNVVNKQRNTVHIKKGVYIFAFCAFNSKQINVSRIQHSL